MKRILFALLLASLSPVHSAHAQDVNADYDALSTDFQNSKAAADPKTFGNWGSTTPHCLALMSNEAAFSAIQVGWQTLSTPDNGPLFPATPVTKLLVGFTGDDPTYDFFNVVNESSATDYNISLTFENSDDGESGTLSVSFRQGDKYVFFSGNYISTPFVGYCY